jgi:hypothetical protein
VDSLPVPTGPRERRHGSRLPLLVRPEAPDPQAPHGDAEAAFPVVGQGRRWGTTESSRASGAASTGCGLWRRRRATLARRTPHRRSR